MADKAHLLTDKKLEQMEKRLSAIYSEAQADVQKKANAYFSKFKAEDEKQRELVKKGQLTETEYKKWRQGKIMYGERFTAMKEDISKQLLNVNKTATAYINGELPEVYSINYNALADSVDGLGGYSFTLVDPETVRNLAQADKSLLPLRELDPAKDIPWNMKKINGQVLQGIILGESVPDISKRILNVQTMNKNAAIRSARTIVTGAENKGRIDSYKRAEADGIILEKEWLAAIDSHTRDWHIELDGVSIPVDQPFSNAIGKIMYPGDPSADGANVYNCRCTLVSKIKGFKKAQVQKKQQDSDNLPQKPIRPKKKDYGTEEEYFKAREKYKAEKEEYEKKISDVVNRNLSRERRYESVESLKNWAKSKGIKVDDSIGAVDVRAFDDYITTTDKLFEKYPQVLRWYKEHGYSYTLDTITDVGTLASAGHGFSFGRLFSNYENVLQEYMEAITSGGQVRGDGTIAGLFRHEFGHELDTTIRMSLYGDLEKRKEYRSDIRSLYGKSGMSEYATVNEEEMFAEAFAEYESGFDSEFAKAFEKLIRKWLK